MRVNYSGRALATVGMLVAAAMLVSCSSGAESKGSGSTTGTSNSAKAQTVAVSLKDNVFEQKEITVEKGVVAFEVKNNGAMIHNMHIVSTPVEGKDFSSKMTIEAGASDKFSATFTKAATIKFQCDLHMPDMIGTITVK